VANVAGTQEPIYGPSAIQSIAEEAKTTPYSELTRDDMKWEVMQSTCVETQSFYFMSDEGRLGFAQVIYSNVAYVLSSPLLSSPMSLDNVYVGAIVCLYLLTDTLEAASERHASSTARSSN
jgi:hypothetical protein